MSSNQLFQLMLLDLRLFSPNISLGHSTISIFFRLALDGFVPMNPWWSTPKERWWTCSHPAGRRTRKLVHRWPKWRRSWTRWRLRTSRQCRESGRCCPPCAAFVKSSRSGLEAGCCATLVLCSPLLLRIVVAHCASALQKSLAPSSKGCLQTNGSALSGQLLAKDKL